MCATRRAGVGLGITVGLASLGFAQVAGAAPTVPPCGSPVVFFTTATVTCAYDGTTGADGYPQTWTVPAEVSQATFDVFGAQGGSDGANGTGGLGGETKAVLSVTTGTAFTIVVAGQGLSEGTGGFGGGGAGAPQGSGGGGGSSVIGPGPELLLAAGGGGGIVEACSPTRCGNGGSGGGLSGTEALTLGDPNAGSVGAPGTQERGGKGGSGGIGGTGASGGEGVLGEGGAGAPGSATVCGFGGGGGGGGYYGGGGGGGCAGGAGGSGFATPSAVSSSLQTGVRSGNGLVTIEYAVIAACTSIQGYGRVGSLANEGVIVQDAFSSSKGAKEVFEAGIQKSKLGELRLTALSDGSCTAINGGREFSGYGPATLKGVSGYQAAFSFAVVGPQITFTLDVTKGKEVIYKTSALMLKGSVEKLSPPAGCPVSPSVHPAVARTC